MIIMKEKTKIYLTVTQKFVPKKQELKDIPDSEGVDVTPDGEYVETIVAYDYLPESGLTFEAETLSNMESLMIVKEMGEIEKLPLTDQYARLVDIGKKYIRNIHNSKIKYTDLSSSAIQEILLVLFKESQLSDYEKLSLD